ncbi:MAG: PHP domain-containing protein [Actinobacteria bacterium]|nr:PHP domain-containing protein [Actinomycetota bacterium]
MSIDLHLHSTMSDGTFSPAELVSQAEILDLRAIAITDHDSVDGIEIGIEEGKKRNVEVIPGVELSSDLDGIDIHFLGYFIDYKNSDFVGHLKKLRYMRYERASRMVEELKQIGINVDLVDVLDIAKEGCLGRSHIARAMIKRGYIDSIEEAFEKYIGRQAACYVEKYAYAPKDVIELINNVGGISVLAHPGISDCDEMISEFVRFEMKGIEVIHSEHTLEQIEHYTNLANGYNLLITGGSDCHGLSEKREMKMGSVIVPDSFLDDIRSFKENGM